VVVKTSLASAPIVIAKRKVINVRIRGEFAGGSDERLVGKKETLTVDMQTQGFSDIRYMIRRITIEETDNQIRLKNPPSRIAVDNREGKQLALVERRTEVTYGNFLDVQMLKFVERSLMSAIKSLGVSSSDRALGNLAAWEWRYVADPSKNKVGVKLRNKKSLKALRVGSYLVLKPKSIMVGVANMKAARKDAGWPKHKWVYGTGSSGGKGFMAKSIDTMKRSNLLKNYTIHVSFTKRFRVRGETYRETSSFGAVTPVIVVRTKRNRRYKRIK